MQRYLKVLSKKKINKKKGGLSRIARWVLHLRLDKFEQLSNWSLRPLRESQLKYAALDSIVETHIYLKLKHLQTLNQFPSIDGFFDDLWGET